MIKGNVNETQDQLSRLLAEAWNSFGRAAALQTRVTPAIPILFFGDLDAYCSSHLRVLTTGLNPSLKEFPVDSPFQRFPLAESTNTIGMDRYLASLSAYFRVAPYRSWFSAFEPFLNGLGASYYEGQCSTALHTDICSPVATNPTWSGLDRSEQDTLAADGVPLWHALLKVLQPRIVVLSVARDHLSRICFKALNEWQTIRVFDRTGDGALRKQPIHVRSRWYEVGGEESLFVFVPAAQTPLGRLGKSQRQKAGEITLGVMRHG